MWAVTVRINKDAAIVAVLTDKNVIFLTKSSRIVKEIIPLPMRHVLSAKRI